MARRVLLVYPEFPGNNLLNYQYMCDLYPGCKSVMPPLGLTTFAGLLDDRFAVRMVDCNVEPLTDADLAWADAVAISGMHPQRPGIHETARRARDAGCATVLGGPSVNICPEYYPELDALHVGEIGDATTRLVAWLAGVEGPQEAQQVFTVEEKTPMDDQPMPRFGVLDPAAYLTMPIQFSVGCPFTCEFCDIPVIYGRVPRIKSGERVVREIQAIYDTGFVGTVIFVDDNLIANRRALREMLPALAEWQRANGYPYPLASEASLNLAKDTTTLEMLREARMTHLFVGIETPNTSTLQVIDKRQNTRADMVESLHTIESYGIEILIGIILGFDTDTRRSGAEVRKFVHEAHVPIVYFNLLAALPKTPLWHRLTDEGRLRGTQSDRLLRGLTSNVEFTLPEDVVKEMLYDCVRDVYSPEQTFARYTWNCENVYGRTLQGIPPVRTWKERAFVIRFTLGTLWNVIWIAGIRAPWRRLFWRYVRRIRQLKREGRIASVLEALLRTVPNARHLIVWGERLLVEAAQEPGDEAREAA